MRGKRLIRIFFFQAEDGIRDVAVTGVQTCALPISGGHGRAEAQVCDAFGRQQAGRVASELARRTVARAVGSHAGDGNRARGQTLRDCWRLLASAAGSTTAAGATEQSRERTQAAGGGPAQKDELAEIG